MSKASDYALYFSAAVFIIVCGFAVKQAKDSSDQQTTSDVCEQFVQQGRKVIRAGQCYVEIGTNQYVMAESDGHVYTREEIFDKVR